MKKPQIRASWTAVLAALGATAAMLPVQAQNSPGMGNAPLTSTHQPEMSNAPGQDAAGTAGTAGSSGSTGTQGAETGVQRPDQSNSGSVRPSESGLQSGGVQGQDAQGSGMQGESGAAPSSQPPTSVYQPEMRPTPGQEPGAQGAPQDMQQPSRDAQGMGMGSQSPGMMQGAQPQSESGAAPANQPPTSVYQPEMRPTPGQGPGAQGMPSSPDAQGMGMGSQGAQPQGQSGAMPSSQPPLTSTHQPEMSNAPGQQGPGSQGMPSSDAQGMGMGSQGAQPQGQSGAMPSNQPPTSVYQPEMRPTPGQQGSSAQDMGMQGSAASMQQGIQTDQRPLTREEVQAETQAWREAGLLHLIMLGEGSSSFWTDPQVVEARDQVNAEVRAARGWDDPNYGTRDAGGGMGTMGTGTGR